MDSPFIYNTIVSGTDFIPRNTESDKLYSAIKEHRCAAIYEPPKSGKQSLINHTLEKIKVENWKHRICKVDLFNVRTEEHLFRKCTEELEKTLPLPPSERQPFSTLPEFLREVQRRAESAQTNLILIFDEFHEILRLEDWDTPLRTLEKELEKHQHPNTSVVFCGSFTNAMRVIFDDIKFFYHVCDRIRFSKIDEKSFTDFIIRSFLKAGRVVSKELALHIYRLTNGQPWYTQQLADIAYSLTRGYLTEAIINQAYELLMELHSYRFKYLTARLSNYQISFLKAIIDGVDRFSSLEALTTYNLQSSANVNRIKDALTKKEIIEFSTKTHRINHFLDPLYETWLRTRYFV